MSNCALATRSKDSRFQQLSTAIFSSHIRNFTRQLRLLTVSRGVPAQTNSFHPRGIPADPSSIPAIFPKDLLVPIPADFARKSRYPLSSCRCPDLLYAGQKSVATQRPCCCILTIDYDVARSICGSRASCS